MLLVLEGCDGVGKTTLAHRIATAIAGEDWTDHPDYAAVLDPDGPTVQIIHRGPPQRHPLEEYALDLDGYRPGSGPHLIADRLHLGEPIYGELYRGESKLGGLGGPGMRWLHLYLRSRGALTVHVDASMDVLRTRLETRGEDYLQAHDVPHVWHAYKDACRRYADRCVNTDAEVDVRRLIDDARAREHDASLIRSTDRWLGSTAPRVLLVGEETSPRHLRGERPTYRAPFVPYPDGSGWFLLDALPADLWRHVAIANALEVNVAALHLELGCPPVVALGGAASVAISNLDHARVPHPQYVRRFHHARRDEYGAMIASVVGTDRKVSVL